MDGGSAAVWQKICNRIRFGQKFDRILPRAPGANDFPTINSQYARWIVQHQLAPVEIERMRAQLKYFAYSPLISIIIPVYNTEEPWLHRAVESVQAQLYGNWEICVVNDSSTKSHIRPILDEYALSNPKIRVKHLSKRAGIAGASSEALIMARGEFVGLLDHDDELSPDTLWEMVNRLNRNPDLDLLYSDEDKLALDGTRVDPFFKPDWSPDLLLSMNYIAHFSVFRRSVLQSIGGFRLGYDGAQDHDLMLRFTERTDRIAHVPKILYHWRMNQGSAAHSPAAKPFASENGCRAIEDALKRRGDVGSVRILSPGKYMVRYRLRQPALVSIIVPTKDRVDLLRNCIRSIEEKTHYRPYEIIIIDNNSAEPESIKYLDTLSLRHRVFRYDRAFNFSTIINFGADRAEGDYLVFVNNDTEVIEPEWLTAMIEQAQRPEVGVVGAKLLYPNNCIQHAGVLVGFCGGAGHAFRNLPDNRTAYFGFADVIRNTSAVTAACMAVRRKLFLDFGGFDEQLKVVFNDVDFCLRVRKQGYRVVYTPLAVLYHFESATRGRLRPSKEEELFRRRWRELIDNGDDYYNPNLSLAHEDWSLRV